MIFHKHHKESQKGQTSGQCHHYIWKHFVSITCILSLDTIGKCSSCDENTLSLSSVFLKVCRNLYTVQRSKVSSDTQGKILKVTSCNSLGTSYPCIYLSMADLSMPYISQQVVVAKVNSSIILII